MRLRTIFRLIAAGLLLTACGDDPAASTDDGLVAHYPLDGDASELVNGNDGVVVGATVTPDRSGAGEGALHFAGVGAFVEIADGPALNVTQDFTIAAWIRTDGNSEPDEWWTIFEKSDPERGGHSRYGLWIREGYLSACFEASDNSTQPCTEARVQTPIGEWHHVAGVRSGRRLMIYLDGNEVANGFVGLDAVSQTAYSAFIGTDAYESDARWLQASVDDIRVYDRALGADEVGALNERE